MTNGSGRKIEILLAEDNANEASATLNTLKKANICNQIHVVREGKEALDFLFQRPSSPELLVLLSLKLADGHGLGVLRKLKGDERTKTLPVIILTSSQEERGVMQSYKLGANACIVKPLDMPKLVEAIAELRLGWLLVSADDTRKI
jgi:two-component system response regulator